jgi:S-DNA-T family DNA segregation ATPase FtsK/SpoIIIE
MVPCRRRPLPARRSSSAPAAVAAAGAQRNQGRFMRSTRSVSVPLAGEGAVRRLLRRNLGATVGLGLLALAAAVAASLATWTVDDPSLSHATDRAARNVLGFPGAILADLATQFLGLAASLALVPPVIWAWRLVFALPARVSRGTVAAWLLAVMASTAALSLVPPPASWPLPIGLGGVTGDLLLHIPAFFAGGKLSFLARAGLGFGLAAFAVAAFLFACGLIFRRALEDDDEAPAKAPVLRAVRTAVVNDVSAKVDRAADIDDEDSEEADDDAGSGRFAVLLGALAHARLRFGASLKRRLAEAPARLARRAEPEFDPDRDRRFEPRFGAGAPAPDPDAGLLPAEEEDIELELELEEPAPPTAPKVPRKAPSPKAKPARARAPERFELPPLTLLAEPARNQKATINHAVLEQNARLLEGVLDDFGVRGEIVNVRPGPVVTLYELEPAPGIKSARVIGLADDIARSMSAIACRVAVIPGKNAIGIELPNARRETVYLRELLASEDFEKSKSRLGLCLGKTIGGEPVIADLARMPHLLVAGTTGSGKSVSINTMILSLLYRLTPAECRLIMIDPKMLELSTYDGIPHLLTPVVTDPKQAVVALKWTVREMEDRYRKMSKLGVRNIDGYNARLAQARQKGETIARTVQTGFDPETGEAIYEQEELSFEPMPFIVVIIDEMADLMMVAGKDIEGAVQRLAQMARAAGIHVVMATQRPSVDVITGTIKANFPTRISFQVTSKIDSRTILGEQGAEQLLGQGDMLYMAGGGRIQRVHGPFVSDQEVEEIVAHLKAQGVPQYLEAITADEDEDGDGGFDPDAAGGEESADLYDRAVAIVIRDRKASTSYIQRRLGIGYNRAASIIERMEKEGVVGPANHAGKRAILVGEDMDGGHHY